MEKFEFKSQICTTREQSERLLALGLKKETADCHWCYHSVTATWYAVTHPYDGIGDWLPAWSLHRLIELYSDVEDTSSLCIKDVSYKLLIFCIEKAIHCGFFNKDYLEEKK